MCRLKVKALDKTMNYYLSCVTVILNGHSSRTFCTNLVVLQGPILGGTLFLISINELPGNTCSKLDIYADDADIYYVGAKIMS